MESKKGSFVLDNDFDREIENPDLLTINYFPHIDREIDDPNYYFLIEDLVWHFEEPPPAYYIYYDDEFMFRLPINYSTDRSLKDYTIPEFAREFVKTLVIIE